MGKLELFQIKFDNPIATYYAGQNVTGKVVVHLKEAMPMRGIYLKLEGKAYVHWTERKHHTTTTQGRTRNQSRNVHRTATQTYFDIKQGLWGTGSKATLAKGHYEFPFIMTLPIVLPTSFEGTHGHVRYHCQASIDRPWKFDPRCKVAFTVLSIVDLNSIPEASKSLTKENQKHLGLWCCKSGPIMATVSMNKMGVVPGENIVINAIIENTTDSEMSRTFATLMTRITYRAQGHMKVQTMEVCRIQRGAIAPHSSDTWSNVLLKVPSLPPTGDCHLIGIDYYLVFTVDPPGLSFDLNLEFPVLVGTIPLRVDFSHFQPVTQPYYAPNTYPQPGMNLPGAQQAPHLPSYSDAISTPDSMGFMANVPSAPPMYEPPIKEMYPDLPPPSYEECVYGRVNITEEEDGEHMTGQLDYAPRYIYYNQTLNQ